MLKLRLLALQQFERIGAIGGHMRRHLAVPVDVKAYVDATEFGRIEPDIELVGIVLRAGRKCHREGGDGHGTCGRGRVRQFRISAVEGRRRVYKAVIRQISAVRLSLVDAARRVR